MVGADRDIEQAEVGCFLAVQQDTAVTCVDWEVFHGWRVGDPEFAGAISVQDRGGAQVACADWTVPTDSAADRCLADLGWLRVDAWSWDWFHRRVAPVSVAPVAPAPPSLPSPCPPPTAG